MADLTAGLVRHVDLPEGGVALLRCKFGGERLAFRLQHVKDGDLRPLLRHADDAGAADADRTPGHDGGFSKKPVHWAFSLPVKSPVPGVSLATAAPSRNDYIH